MFLIDTEAIVFHIESLVEHGEPVLEPHTVAEVRGFNS